MKKLLIFMSVLMIGSQIRPMSERSREILITYGAAYIGTSIVINATVSAVKHGIENTSFTQESTFPYICGAMTGIMVCNGGEYKTSCYLGVTTALFVAAYKANQTDSSDTASQIAK